MGCKDSAFLLINAIIAMYKPIVVCVWQIIEYHYAMLWYVCEAYVHLLKSYGCNVHVPLSTIVPYLFSQILLPA